jgi:hypothetical protein
MTPIHTQTVQRPDETVTFDYYTAAVGANDLIVAAIVVADHETVRAYHRIWPLDRWSVPTRANFEAKFLANRPYRARFQVS